MTPPRFPRMSTPPTMPRHSRRAEFVRILARFTEINIIDHFLSGRTSKPGRLGGNLGVSAEEKASPVVELKLSRLIVVLKIYHGAIWKCMRQFEFSLWAITQCDIGPQYDRKPFIDRNSCPIWICWLARMEMVRCSVHGTGGTNERTTGTKRITSPNKNKKKLRRCVFLGSYMTYTAIYECRLKDDLL